jgi:integrase
MKPRRTKVRGKECWVVETYHGGKRRWFFFATRAEADRKAAQLHGDREGFGAAWLQLDPRARAGICEVLAEMDQQKVKLRDVWEAYKRGDVRGVAASVTVEKALAELLTEKRADNLRAVSIADLNRVVRQFAGARLNAPVSSITDSEVRAFVAAPDKAGSRATRRARLLSFFKFCLRRKWITSNPCDTIRKPKVDRQPPHILTLDQVRQLLAVIEAEHPQALAWFTLALFAGIRPEECDHVKWANVDFDRGMVHLPAANHKTRKQHDVELPANALAWLIQAHEQGAHLPFPKSNRRRVLRALRDRLGFTDWPKDVLRHSFCSYGSVQLGQVTTARLADHSEATLRRHYLNRVSVSAAKEFFSIQPKEPNEHPSLSNHSRADHPIVGK